MMRGMYSAVSGLRTHQTMLDVTANDLANVNTIGYKGSRMMFRDSLTQLQRSGAQSSAATGGANAAQVGLGVQLGSIDNLMGGGFHIDNPQAVSSCGCGSSFRTAQSHNGEEMPESCGHH